MGRPANDTPPSAPRRSGLLDAVERFGNAMPDTATLFALLAVAILVASWLAARLHVSVVHPRDGSVIAAVDLLSRDGVRRAFTDAVKNFMGFAPLGTVLVAMVGIGVAERSGLIALSLRALMSSMPRTLLTATIIFSGMLAHMGADAGIIILPPIGALLFAAAGRHPLAGLAAAFAGVAGAFSANVLPTPLDVLLIAFTQEATHASKLLPGYEPQLLGNYYFLAVTAPVLTVVGTWVTHRFVEPRLGPWKPGPDVAPLEGHTLADVTPGEWRGLRWAGVATVATVVFFLSLVVPSWAPLREEGPNTLARIKPFFDSIVVLMMILFFVPGVVFGVASGRIRSDRDIAKMTGDSLGSMGTYIVLAFTASQFIAYFNWSNLGAILAISGAHFLQGLGLAGAPLLVGLVLFSGAFDLVITSASAKWAMMAPVFVPMFAMLGFTPEATQVVFRIGASVVNIVTPCFPYLPIILVAARRYDAKAGNGTIISLMIPYSIAFLVAWTVLLLVFYGLHLPIGPGVQILLPR